MSSALSNQSFVDEGVGYDEVFSLGQSDLGTSSEKRNPSTTSSSTRDEDLDTDRLEGDFTKGVVGAKPPTQSVIGPDGLREFIILCCGWSTTLYLPSNNHISIHLGTSTKFPSTYPSVYLINWRSVIMRVLKTSESISKC